mmetsp:Transcript_20613/g.19954  ORF Transcript_20613/g.19954 Transcript_20613/m.19954 type:complete len:209 (+) Transcript_20613:245-871(+)
MMQLNCTSFYYILMLLCLSGNSQSPVNKKKGNGLKTSYVVELSYTNVTLNYENWDTDMAIMFYAPWCERSRKLSKSWEKIAIVLSNNKDLIVGQFNCEKPAGNLELCTKLGIERFPSVFFLGYDNRQLLPKKEDLFMNPHPRFIRYTATLYPNAIYDWIRMLNLVSKIRRKFYDLRSYFYGHSRIDKKIRIMELKVNELERKDDLFSE